jgi:hypothetical protein
MANKPTEFPIFTELSEQEIIQTIYYAFRYRDLSKEAVMVISKSLIG